ncbi:MAG: nitroreductase family protein [Bacillota bacterium]|jgi:nitroreductase
MEFFKVVAERYSVRSYRPDPVEPEKLQQVLEAARLAPTACNLQAFKLLVIKTEGRRAELKRVYRQEWFASAPYVLGVCAIPGKGWVRGQDRKSYAAVDAAIVMDHLILAATALGLGTCWIGAFDPRAAREVLAFEDAWEPVAFTPLGYPGDTKVDHGRKPLADLVIYQ